MRASPSLSQLWQPHSRLCQLCRVCEQQRSCSPGFCRKELHATESAVEVRRARRRLEDTVTDERVGLFTPDKDGDTHELRPCRRHSGEARDRLWRSGSRPSISFNPASTPFSQGRADTSIVYFFQCTGTFSLLGEKGEAGAISRPLGALPLSAVGVSLSQCM